MQAGVTGKRLLAAATAALPHRLPIHGGFRSRRRVFHFAPSAPETPAVVDRGAVRRLERTLV